MKLVRPEKLSLLTHKELNETWVQKVIAEDPTILGLGDLILKDKERIHPKAGRLDILLQDAESKRRYEVEIQLGKVDESHIIRTIEYWDVERSVTLLYNPKPRANARNSCFLNGFTARADWCNIPRTDTKVF